MTHKRNVQAWYSLLNAAWYDPFRKLWTKLVSEKAEEEFTRRMKKAITPKTRILELGCGTGINVDRIQNMKFKEYTGLDFSPSMLAIAKRKFSRLRNVSFVRGDITKDVATTGNKKYDCIISTWVLSHLAEPSKVINKYYKNLRSGGRMLLLFLSRPKWHIHFWLYPLVRLFAAQYVPPGEIEQMPGKHAIHRYAAGMATLMEIRK